MKRYKLFSIAIAAILLSISVASFANHPLASYLNLGIGDNVFPFLRTWGGQDQAQAHLYVSTNTGLTHNAFFYNKATTRYQTGLSAAGYTNSGQITAGSSFYGEADFGATNAAWGSNIIGKTYSTSAPAHGLEVNGVNQTSGTPVVDGVFVVNGGSAKTTAGIVVATSILAPAGRPDYGIMLTGPNGFYTNQNVATITGLYIDRVNSQEAIRIQADHRIALSNNGNTYIRYNSATNTVQIVKNGILVAQF